MPWWGIDLQYLPYFLDVPDQKSYQRKTWVWGDLVLVVTLSDHSFHLKVLQYFILKMHLENIRLCIDGAFLFFPLFENQNDIFSKSI